MRLFTENVAAQVALQKSGESKTTVIEDTMGQLNIIRFAKDFSTCQRLLSPHQRPVDKGFYQETEKKPGSPPTDLPSAPSVPSPGVGSEKQKPKGLGLYLIPA